MHLFCFNPINHSPKQSQSQSSNPIIILSPFPFMLLHILFTISLLVPWLDNLTNKVGSTYRVTLLDLDATDLTSMWCGDDHFLSKISGSSMLDLPNALPSSSHSERQVDHPSSLHRHPLHGSQPQRQTLVLQLDCCLQDQLWVCWCSQQPPCCHPQ